ncbi:MAG: PGPGW domain-containing protein [bacterium]|nr:PGPGW domain-containing protein [bacterium]
MLKKIIGVLAIIVGVLALVTPFTPGAWLIFVGLGLLGVRILFWEKLKARLARTPRPK